MATDKLKLTPAWQAVGDGSKAVLIVASGGNLCWCDNDAPVAGGPEHFLAAGDEILLPAGMHVQARCDDATYPGEVVFTVYP